jgi:rhamnosyl/mannosyltransferase
MESHLEDLSTELKDFVKLRLIVANDGRETVSESRNGVNVTRLGELFKFQSAPICPALISEVRRQEPDIVHIHWPNPTAVLAYLVSGLKAKLIFTYHSDVVRQRKLAMAFQPLLHIALHQASAIIATSPDYIDSSCVLAAYRAKCRVIPFGVRSEYFAETDSLSVKRIRNQYGPQILLAVGRLVHYKGFEHLVRAMASAKGRLLLIGCGPDHEALQKLATELKVRDRVVFLNEVEDLRPYYQAADVFVLPSIMRSEAFGIVQLEAMACGKPIINTRLDSGVNFVAPDGVSALTVQPGNHLQLAHAINYLLERPYLRKKLGIGGRRRVREMFTVSGMVRQTLNLYEEVTSNGNGEAMR